MGTDSPTDRPDPVERPDARRVARSRDNVWIGFAAACLATLLVTGCATDPAVRPSMAPALATTAEATAGSATAPELARRLATGSRSAAEKARDAGRRPAPVLAFLGVEPGMTVIDVIAAGGYYTEVLAEAVGPNGKVYAQNIDFVLEMREGANDKALSARLADGRLPNVERLDREFDALGLAPESVDLALTALNLHDILDGNGPVEAAEVLHQLRRILVPGGVLGVVDHAGQPGRDAENKKNHRIDESRVLEAVLAAGFELEATSDVLRNPADDLTRGVFAPDLRGRTDRFVLKFRKPR